MVRVNGKKFKTYELDSLDSFKHRLAYDIGTLESFLYFPVEINDVDIRNKKNNIIVEDLLAEIKKSAINNSSVVELVDNIQKKIGKTKFDRGKKIVKLWLLYNTRLTNNVKQQGKIVLDSIGDNLQKSNIYITSKQIHTSWSDLSNIKKDMEYNITNNENRVVRTLKIFNEYDDISESYAYTDFEISHVKFTITLKLKNLSLMELFNLIELNSMVSFATTNNFYKIIDDFVPPDEWNESVNDLLMLKVYQKNYISSNPNILNYEESLMEIDPETKNVIVKISINPGNNNVTRDKYIERTLSVFKNIDIKIQKISESGVKGVFYYPLLRLDKYVFGDLVLNDEIFGKLISIDEHDKATKNKPGIHIHFEHPKTGYITATITGRFMVNGDQTMKNVDLDFFESGGPFIRVKISKADNEKSVKIFQEMMGKLFILYEQKKDNIIDFYKNYIQDFGDVVQPEEEEVKDKKLSEIAPDLFVPMYSTWCKHERMPTIISEEEVTKSKNEGKSVLKFPRDIPSDPKAFKFPMDGQNQQYYVCNKPGFKYPGIKNNKLKNQDKFPYVPCCFEKPQENKPKYLNYYEGKELIIGEKKQNNIIQTNKILDNNQFGTLPVNIENLFTIIDPNPKFEYVRKGVYDSRNSFINVVMEALNDETKILDMDEKEQLNIFAKERLGFANKNIVSLCRQELYDLNPKQISKLIKDKDVYFDPNIFIHLLEDRFDCNIYLFSKKILDGEMTLPRHVQAYYKNRNRKRSIYVYEHMGSVSDNPVYPHCELIVKYDTKKRNENVQYSFTHKETRNIRDVFGRLRKSYSLNKVIKESYLPLNSSIKIKSQWIDSYGKTRKINVLYLGETISLIISPIQPIKVRETINPEIFLTSIKTAFKLVESLQIEISTQTVLDGVVRELTGVLGNVTISIPINNGVKINGIPEKQNGLSFPEKTLSLLDKYNNNKKIARYLVEYVLWIYSFYLYDNDITEITDNNISQFAKDFFVIKDNYNYGYIEKSFNKSSNILNKGKIVVHDKETVKRLIYGLRLSVKRNVDGVKNYYTRTTIQNYYVDITDFDKYSGQVILFGEESVDKWIYENNIIYTIHNEVKIGRNTPYFFKNTLIDDNIYLAQNTQTLEKASDIAVSWIRKGYNIGMRSENRKPVNFILYSYLNKYSIKKGIKIKGKPFSDEIKILGYKIDNIPEYTVLMDLS
jgi:hypothetical protein